MIIKDKLNGADYIEKLENGTEVYVISDEDNIIESDFSEGTITGCKDDYPNSHWFHQTYEVTNKLDGSVYECHGSKILTPEMYSATLRDLMEITERSIRLDMERRDLIQRRIDLVNEMKNKQAHKM